MEELKINDVVQFTEKHKWCGCLGIIEEVKKGLVNNKYLIGVPMPERGTAYIFDNGSNIEYIGPAIMIKEEDPA